MKISARNTLKGKIVSLISGTVNTEVQLELPGGDIIVSVLTKEAAQKLELEVGKTAYAIVDAYNVLLGVD
jgi:molybdopterin-binding protein